MRGVDRMWILILLVGFFVLGIGLVFFSKDDGSFGAGVGLMIICGLALSLLALDITFTRIETRTKVAEYRAMFETFRDNKEHNSGVLSELTVHKFVLYNISNANEWIRAEKEWNASTFDWWVDDSIESVEEFRWGE